VTRVWDLLFACAFGAVALGIVSIGVRIVFVSNDHRLVLLTTFFAIAGIVTVSVVRVGFSRSGQNAGFRVTAFGLEGNHSAISSAHRAGRLLPGRVSTNPSRIRELVHQTHEKSPGS
jgi:hypothetical protein